VVVGVDDLVGAGEGQPVGRDDRRDAAGLEHARDLGHGALRVGHVLDRLDRDHRGEARVRERQRAHVGHHGLAVLAREGGGVDVHRHGLARRQQRGRMARAGADVEHTTARGRTSATRAQAATWRWNVGLKPPSGVVTRSAVCALTARTCASARSRRGGA
jgi:hypothetical protein